VVAAGLWACSAAIRLWRNACIAWAGSEEVADELVEEELVDDDEPDDELALEVEVVSPVAPICASASMMEFIKPPPDGGGGGGMSVELTSEEFVTSDCALVLLVLELAVNCASQLFMLETLLIVMSISVPVELRVNTT
jgi:hypothetical protein